MLAAACAAVVLAMAGVAADAAVAQQAPPTTPPRVEAVHVLAPERPEVRRLGEVVAADHDLVAVAAPTDGDDALDPGRVIIVDLSSDIRGSLIVRRDAVLFSHPHDPGDHFGASLAVRRRCAEAAGVDFVAVGADRANAVTGETGAGAAAGAVEIFERAATDEAPWRPAVRLTAREPEPGASFGAALSFDRAGSVRLAVGAPRHDAPGAFDAGRVLVFRRLAPPRGAEVDARWTEVASIVPPTARMSMWFGSVVALDGDLLAIASPGDDVAVAGRAEPVHAAGAVYLYRRVSVAADGRSERYRLERVLTAPDPEPSAWFGLALDLDSGVLAVGSPRARDATTGDMPTGCVHLFDLAQPGSTPKRIDPPAGAWTYGFGLSIALRGDHLLVGAPSTDRSSPAMNDIELAQLLGGGDSSSEPLEDAGAAWVYSLGRADYACALEPPKPLRSGLFGASCAIASFDAPSATRPEESSDPQAVAIVGHRFVEEESIAPSRGAALFVLPNQMSYAANRLTLQPGPRPAPP